LVFTPYVTLFIDPDTRVFRTDWTDPLSLLVSMLSAGFVVGGMLFLAMRLTGRDEAVPSGHGSVVLLFCVAVFLSARDLTSADIPYWRSWDWVLVPCLAFVALTCFLESGRTIRRFLDVAFRVMTPVLFVVAASLLHQEYRMTRPVPPSFPSPSVPAASVLPDVYLFVFDGWGYKQTFPEGEVDGRFTHLRDLAAESTVYHDALAPGRSTRISVPRLIHQSSGTDGRPMAESRTPTLFDLAKGLGYETALLCSIELDIDSRNIDEGGVLTAAFGPSSVWERALLHVVFLGGAHTRLPYYHRHQNDFSAPAYEKVLNLYHTRRVLRRWMGRRGAPHFCVVYFFLPHSPYAFNRSGLRLLTKNPDGLYYDDNMLYADNLLGEIADELRRQDRYDDSVVVVTSDHAPNRRHPTEGRHVPLLVKGWRQKARVDVRDRMDLTELSRPLFDMIREGKKPPAP